jgi:UDP-N-acetylglucosamine diphosphorylase / glucose-1-phosphate thymidylyltransferase / UDP-N-acetylgalactosamine diphosphorylase / glucosamine-1-phosphate N-acetyltransferase / galactosamine-1-phosphate N-acetyltransferase
MIDKSERTVAALFELIRSLWSGPIDPTLRDLLPTDPLRLAHFYDRLRQYVTNAPRSCAGTIDPAACVQGEIVATGLGSVIEAGALVHRSCRLILGPNSVVRAGAVLRDEVVIGPNCMVGVHCEVARSVLLGPSTELGHFVYLADSLLGARVMVAGNTWVANTTVGQAKTIPIIWDGRKVDSGRSHLGMLVGDGVRFGASTTVCPGCIVTPGLVLPPSVTLDGIIDPGRRRALMRQFANTWSARRR